MSILLALSACTLDLGAFTRSQPLTETVVLGESGPKILMLELEGLLTESPRRRALGTAPSLVARAREALERAREDDDVAAVLLRIRSPGGTVAASETLYHLIEQFKKETGRPVTAQLQGLATSGGYYVAMAADHIVAHPTTITGSIGVLLAGVNVAGLMEKLGIQNQTLTSAEFKDAGSPLRPMRPDERAQLQSVIDDLYARFREVVAAGRPSLDEAAIAKLADGRIFTARQALAAGLIDEIGYLEDSVAETERRAGIEHSRVVVYHSPREYKQNLYSRAPVGPLQVVDVHLLDLGRQWIPPGFWYVWPPALGNGLHP
ncbi:MAG: signal peptide peptidase SppA [Myxococcota bacterium]